MTLLSFTKDNVSTKYFRIGVTGYSSALFEKKQASLLLKDAIKQAIKLNTENKPIAIVSGLTNIGIPALAYQLATELKYYTVGYACKKAEEYDCFDVDSKHIIGTDWGTESETFLENIDAFISIGGGKQTEKERETALEKQLPVFSYPLSKKKSGCLMGYLSKESSEALYELVKDTKGENLFKPEEYHITIRYWTNDIDDEDHLPTVQKHFEKILPRFLPFDISITGKTDVFGTEQAYVLKVKSDTLNKLFDIVNEYVTSHGGSEHTYGSYKAHITIGEKLKTVAEIAPMEVTIDTWKLTSKIDANIDSKVIWEYKAKEKQVKADLITASHLITAEENFINTLKKATDPKEVISYLVHHTSDHIINDTVFDEILYRFFSSLPNFLSRTDFEEQEVEDFKWRLPYEELGLDRNSTRKHLLPYRSINRVITELIKILKPEIKIALAYKHLYDFWYTEKCNGDLQKFINIIRPKYWIGTSSTED